jgi:hypothetical protein
MYLSLRGTEKIINDIFDKYGYRVPRGTIMSAPGG